MQPPRSPSNPLSSPYRTSPQPWASVAPLATTTTSLAAAQAANWRNTTQALSSAPFSSSSSPAHSTTPTSSPDLTSGMLEALAEKDVKHQFAELLEPPRAHVNRPPASSLPYPHFSQPRSPCPAASWGTCLLHACFKYPAPACICVSY